MFATLELDTQASDCNTTGEFKCKTSDQCVAEADRCNFVFDCSDGSDEDTCPWSCDFESKKNPYIYQLMIKKTHNVFSIKFVEDNTLCRWEDDRSTRSAKWMLASANSSDTIDDTFRYANLSSTGKILLYEFKYLKCSKHFTRFLHNKDHTTYSSDGHFVFVDWSSAHSAARFARLRSPVYNQAGHTCSFEFW